jgi:hypothetical protein
MQISQIADGHLWAGVRKSFGGPFHIALLQTGSSMHFPNTICVQGVQIVDKAVNIFLSV